MTFKKGQRINGYTITQVISGNKEYREGKEVYQVRNAMGKTFCMKTFCEQTISNRLRNSKGRIIEIEMTKNVHHPSIAAYVDEGKFSFNRRSYQYLVTEWIEGGTMDEMYKMGFLTRDQVIGITRQLLYLIGWLSHRKNAIHINDIRPDNIMVNEEGIEPFLVSLSSATYASEKGISSSMAQHPFMSTDALRGNLSEEADVFSVLMSTYYLFTGKIAWQVEDDHGVVYPQNPDLIDKIRRSKKPTIDKLFCSDRHIDIICQGLMGSYKASEILAALDGAPLLEKNSGDDYRQLSVEDNDDDIFFKNDDNSGLKGNDKHMTVDIEIKQLKGGGFADIAGMDELKRTMHEKVIFPLQNEKLMKEYRLQAPSGMLLYGPPGCGKSFFAEKFAYESGFKFMLVKGSDIASPYFHATQGKIKSLFDKARLNAPVVICFDEFDAMVPRRTETMDEHTVQEVGEFLTQMNNCAADHIFIVATTNRPDMIDPAVLRSGRLDMHVYVPALDEKVREAMFRLHLSGRPLSHDFDYEGLASLTNGYIASDISAIINDAALKAAMRRVKISQQMVIDSIRSIKPSLTPGMLRDYEQLHRRMEGKTSSKMALPRVGFLANVG